MHSSREAMIAKVNVQDPPVWHYVWNKVYKTSIIKENSIAFDISRKSGEDVAFNDDFLVASSNVYFLDRYLYLYDCSNATSLTRQKPQKTSTPTYEQALSTWQQELKRYEKLVRNSQHLCCHAECIERLQKDFCMYLFRLRNSTRQYDYHSQLMQDVRQFDDYEAVIKHLAAVRRQYAIGKLKGKFRQRIKKLMKLVLRE